MDQVRTGAADEPGPPPTPAERQAAREAARVAEDEAGRQAGRAAVARRRRRVGGLAVVVALAAIAGAALAGAMRTAPAPEPEQADEGRRDAILLDLLRAIEDAEEEMHRFNDAQQALFDESTGPEEFAELVAVAAAEAADALRDHRRGLVPLSGDVAADELRAIYLPHLDSWVDFLDAYTEDLGFLYDGQAQTPYLLLINSTAEAFRMAMEDLVEMGPGEAVVELAEAILDRGFRSDQEAGV